MPRIFELWTRLTSLPLKKLVITDWVENDIEQNKTQTKNVFAHRSVIWSEKIKSIYF